MEQFIFIPEKGIRRIENHHNVCQQLLLQGRSSNGSENQQKFEYNEVVYTFSCLVK